MMDNNIDLARKLYEIRNHITFTQKHAAIRFGVSESTYKKWEQGSVKVNGEQLVMLAEFYGVTADYLLCMSDDPEGYSPDLSHARELSDEEKKLVDAYRSASPTARAAILASVHAIAASIGEGVGTYTYEKVVGS